MVVVGMIELLGEEVVDLVGGEIVDQKELVGRLLVRVKEQGVGLVGVGRVVEPVHEERA